jgi:hypothetical protein
LFDVQSSPRLFHWIRRIDLAFIGSNCQKIQQKIFYCKKTDENCQKNACFATLWASNKMDRNQLHEFLPADAPDSARQNDVFTASFPFDPLRQLSIHWVKLPKSAAENFLLQKETDENCQKTSTVLPSDASSTSF